MRRPTEGLHLVFPPQQGGVRGGMCAANIFDCTSQQKLDTKN